MIPARQILRVSTQPGGTPNGSSQNQLQPRHWEDSGSSLVVLHCPSQAAQGLSDKAPAAKIAPLSMKMFPNCWVLHTWLGMIWLPIKIINWFLFLFHRKPHQHSFATCLLSGAPPGITQAVKDQGGSPLPPLHTLLSAARPFSYLDSVFSCKNCTRDEAQDILSLKWQKK